MYTAWKCPIDHFRLFLTIHVSHFCLKTMKYERCSMWYSVFGDQLSSHTTHTLVLSWHPTNMVADVHLHVPGVVGPCFACCQILCHICLIYLAYIVWRDSYFPRLQMCNGTVPAHAYHFHLAHFSMEWCRMNSCETGCQNIATTQPW